MQTYSKFRPTGFDPAGAFLDEQQDWLVLPCSQNRDSGCLAQSNFQQALEMLGGESDDVEVHRFGHWGNGWFEIIIVRPGSSAADVARDIEDRLADYPVLNDEDFSQREHDAYGEAWENYGRSDFLDLLGKTYWDGDHDYRAAYRFFEDECSGDELRELFEAGVRSGDYYHAESDGVSINFRSFDLSRKELAKCIRNLRAAHNPRIAWRDPAQGSLFDWS